MATTKYGVAYAFDEPEFEAYFGDWVFRFSSMKHKERFCNLVQARVDWLSDSLSRRFKYPIDAAELAAFQLYQQVETRGFYVTRNTKVYRSQAEITFSVTAYG